MKSFGLGRCALSGGIAVALLAGCGGPPGQAGAPPVPTAPESPTGTSQRDLLYVSNAGGVVTVYRYWYRTFLKQLTGFRAPKGECVDQLGDVFVTDSGLETVSYTHLDVYKRQILNTLFIN